MKIVTYLHFAMDYRIGYRRRLSASDLLRKKRRLVGLALGIVILAVVAAMALRPAFGPEQRKAPSETSGNAALPETSLSAATRLVYPFSIVPGGVGSREELERNALADKVVSEHYASFDVKNARVVLVGKPRWAHVSYRKDDKVYWTSKKVLLSSGETLLTDGAHEIRGRCGNRISEVPLQPVLRDEPELDVPQLVGGYDESWVWRPNGSPVIEAPLPAPVDRAVAPLTNLGLGVLEPPRFFAADFRPPSIEPMLPPGEPTLPPGEPTLPPGEPTLPPGEPTPPPGEPTPPPGEPTLPPGEPTPPPGEPTLPPGEPTLPPGEPTLPPGEPTLPPGEPTLPPGEPTLPPGEPTPPPGEPTLPPGDMTPPTEVPEPGSLWLVFIALAMMTAARRKKGLKKTPVQTV